MARGRGGGRRDLRRVGAMEAPASRVGSMCPLEADARLWPHPGSSPGLPGSLRACLSAWETRHLRPEGGEARDSFLGGKSWWATLVRLLLLGRERTEAGMRPEAAGGLTTPDLRASVKGAGTGRSQGRGRAHPTAPIRPGLELAWPTRGWTRPFLSLPASVCSSSQNPEPATPPFSTTLTPVLSNSYWLRSFQAGTVVRPGSGGVLS